MQPLNTTALLLDRILYSEKDLIVTLLTREHGVISAIAHSARGSRRRFAGALDLFVVFNAVLSRSRRGLATLVGAEPVKQFPGILGDLERLRVAQAMLVLTRDLLRDAPGVEAHFDRLVAGLAGLETIPAQREVEPLLRLCLELLAEMGHPPTTGVCPSCHNAYTEGAVIGTDGLMRCHSCADRGLSIGKGLVSFCLGEGVPVEKGPALEVVTALASAALGRPWRVPLE